jgi:uncharacterized membrane protein YcaP (DUF421 family)
MTPWWFDYLSIVAVATGAYLWLIFVLRVTGKRTLAKLNAFDFAITVAFGSALATVILDESVGLLKGGLVLAVLALLQFVVAKTSQWSDIVRKTVRSRPTLLVRDGKVFMRALYYERITLDELAEVIRNNGYGQLDKVGAVILETDGSFSVLDGEFESFDLLYDVRTFGEPSKEPIEARRRAMSPDGGPGPATPAREAESS